MNFTIQTFGERALLVTLDHSFQPTLVCNALVSTLGVNARSGLNTVLISGSNLPNNDRITEVIEQSVFLQHAVIPAEVTIPVRYNGVDLELVADKLAMTVEGVILAHKSTVWQVVLVGFAPGFPYLRPTGIASPFENIPRLATPRARVPAGAVAIASGMSAVYPNAMPGGWMLLGETDISLFNPQSENPSLLRAGNIVRFIEVNL